MSKHDPLAELIGISLSDFGSDVWGGAHLAGKALLNAFGAGAIAAPLESYENPYLPDWAKSAQASGAPVVAAPDFVVLVPTDPNKKPAVVQKPTAVSINGGRRFDGDPSYRSGDTAKFSFGYDAPTSVDVTVSGKTGTVKDVKQVLFGGGVESGATKVKGDEVIGDFNWWSLFDPTGTYGTYETGKMTAQKTGLMTPGPQYNYRQSGMQNPYLAQRTAAGPSAALTASQQQFAAGQALQQQLRAQQLANIAAMRSQLPPPGVTPSFTPTVPKTFSLPPLQPLAPLAPLQPTASPDTTTSASAPPASQAFDPYNPYVPLDGTDTVTGSERSPKMSNEIDVLGEQIEREMRDLNRSDPDENETFDIDSVLGDLGTMGLVPGAATIGMSPDAAKILSAVDSVAVAHYNNRPDYNDGADHGVMAVRREAHRAAGALSNVRNASFSPHGRAAHRMMGDLGPQGLAPGNPLIGNLGPQGLAPGNPLIGNLGPQGLQPGDPLIGILDPNGNIMPAVDHDASGEIAGHAKSYLYGCDVLGAPVFARNSAAHPLAPRFGITFKASPKLGRKFTSLTINKNKVRFHPQKTLQTARVVAEHAKKAGLQASAFLAKAPTKVHGAVAPRKAPSKAIPKMTVAAAKALALKTVKDAAALSKHADQYAGTIQKFQSAQASKAHRGAAATKVHGLVDVLGFSGQDHDIVGDDDNNEYGLAFFEEIVGDYIDDNGVLQPGTDPNAGQYGSGGAPAGGGSVDPSTGLPAGGSTGGGLASQLPGPPDYGAGMAPTMDSVKANLMPDYDYTPDPGPASDLHFYSYADFQNLINPVIFDGSQRPAYRTLGNYSSFYGTVPGLAAPKGGPFSGFEIHDDGWWLFLAGTQPSTNYSGGRNYDKVDEPSSVMVAESSNNNYGPLIGAPTPPGDPNTRSWTYGLRFVPDGPNGPFWFWYFDTAMQVAPWATIGILQAMLADQVTQYKAAQLAGQVTYLNAVTQDQLDAQDAAKAAKQQAAVDAQVAQQQEIAQEQQAEAQAAYDQQQAQLDLQAQQAQMQIDAQQAQLDLQTQQAQQAYLAQHPEMMFQPPQDQGGGDQGGGEGDMTPMDLSDSQIDWGAPQQES